MVAVFAIDLFPPLKCFTHCLTLASVYAGISVCTLKGCLDIWWGNFLVNKKFYHCALAKHCLLTAHFLALKYDLLTGKMTWFSLLCDTVGGTNSHTTHCTIAGCLFVIGLMTFASYWKLKTAIPIGNFCRFRSAMEIRLNIAAVGICTWIAMTIDLYWRIG